jgi:hypothetical protein
MVSLLRYRLVVVVTGLAGALAAAVVGWFLWRGHPDAPPPSPFRECATEAGITWRMSYLPAEQGENFKINLYDHGSGVAVADYDGDGFDDVYFCNQLGPNALYRNRGDGTFEDVTAKAGVALGDRVCVAATFADYDNDGRPDLFVTSTRGGNVLFHNNGDGTFSDVTEKTGVAHVGHSQSAVFFDYDNDGFLDLLVTNTAAWTDDRYEKETHYWPGKGLFSEVVLSPKEYNVLYHNNGDGTFTDVTEMAGLAGRGWAGDAVAFDYDGDGRLDLFVSCMFGRCQLYRNNGDGKFSDVTLDVLGRTSWGAVGCKAFDFNNDGRLDLFVVDMHSDMWMGLDRDHESLPLAVQSEKVKYPDRYGPLVQNDPTLLDDEKEIARRIGYRKEEVVFGNTFYRNDGGDKLTEVSDAAGLETFWPWGIATGDFDNDGWEDCFVTAGMGYPFYYWPNSLLMNQGDGTFRDRATELGVEPPARGETLPGRVGGQPAVRSSRSAATADFRHSGRLDVVVNNFNDQPYFFRNQGPRKNYVEFRLRGTRCNRDAVGAVVRLFKGGQTLTRQVNAACGYLSQSSKTVHFGLGDRPDIDRVEITWPGGRRQTLTGVAANALHDVVEPDKDGK